MALSDQQKRFVDYYIQTSNTSESCKRPEYKAEGKVADVTANLLLRNVKVQANIEESNKQFESDRITD